MAAFSPDPKVSRWAMRGGVGMSDNVRSAFLMVLSTATFVCNDAVMKSVTQSFPVYQAVFLRGLFILPILMIYAQWQGGLKLRLSLPDLRCLGLRSIGDIGSTILYILALQQMALGDLAAIVQSLPLLVTLAAGLFLGEALGRRRLSAIGLGFLGVLIILRPGTAAFDVWALVALTAVVLIVLRDIASRLFSAAVPSTTIAFYGALTVTLFSLGMSLTEDWQRPSLAEAGWLALAAGLIAVGYVTVVASMRLGEVSFVAPFRYTALIWAIVLGLLVFGEWPDVWTQLGAVLVVAAGLYSIWREARVARGL